jgi:ribosomal protein S18 acetylase RimI-like enzyme
LVALIGHASGISAARALDSLLVDDFEILERAPTVDEFRRLAGSAGGGEIGDEGLAAGLASALYSCVVVHDGDVVACGRVIGDGGMYFYVQDVIVLPEYHGRGLGVKVMDAVVGYLERAARPGAFIGLMDAANAEGFYERYGFRRRPDDRPGMFRVW